jgi:RND superfamily putative drug exporter
MRQWFTPVRWATASASHPRRVVAVWAILLIASLGVIATLLGSATTTQVSFVNSPESKRANAIIENTIGIRSQDTETVVIQSTHGGPPSRAAVDALAARIDGLGPAVVDSAVTPWNGGGTKLISRDGSTVLLGVVMAGSETTATDSVSKVIALATDASSAGLHAQVTGQAAIARDTNTTAGSDLSTGESIGIPVALIVLLIVFGSLVSALLPIGLAVAAIVVSLALTSLVGHVYQLSFFVTNMITMMGLAVGIDYVLFIASRYREERAAGRPVDRAIEIAGRTASRAVLFSGMTVVVALVGLLIVPTTIFLSLATGAILVVLCAVAAAMTLLPASLALLGDRVERGRVGRLLPRRRAAAAASSGGGFWPRAVGAVMRRPVISAVAVVALLVAAAIPYSGMTTGASGVTTLPKDLAARQAYETLSREFPVGGVAPARIPIVGNPASAANRAVIARISRAVAGDPIFGTPSLEPGGSARGAVLDVPINARADQPAGDGCREHAAVADEPARDRAGRREPRLLHHRARLPADRAGDRARPQLPRVAGGVPVAGGAGGRDRDEPALGRRGLRPADARRSGRVRNRSARLPAGAGDRGVDPAVPVRGAVRPVDGLPRVPDLANPRAARGHR